MMMTLNHFELSLCERMLSCYMNLILLNLLHLYLTSNIIAFTKPHERTLNSIKRYLPHSYLRVDHVEDLHAVLLCAV